MREILFRGKVSEDHEQGIYVGSWVCGDLEYNSANNKARIHAYDGNGCYCRQYTVSPDTVGQFTGLHDRNGKEIYECDIVAYRDLTFGLEYVGYVCYDEQIASFRIHVTRGEYTQRFSFISSDTYNDGKCSVECKYEWEVVGNIYDNPELLNQ